jgi:prefoldin alpha subunit
MENTENTQDDQNTQELLYQFRYLKEQRDLFVGQLELMNASLGNIINTKNTLENLKTIKENEEILIPIGGIANVKAIIKDVKKVILFVNQDVAIEKTVDNSIEFIDKIIEQHNTQIKFLREQLQNMDSRLQSMSQSFQRTLPQQS